MNDIFKENVKALLAVQVRNTEAERQARLRAFDKQPELAIEPQSTQDEAKDIIKKEEEKPLFISPKKKEDSLKGVGAFIQGSPIKSKQPTKLSDILKKSPTKAAEEEPESQVVGSSVEGFDEFSALINDAKKVKNKDLGQILIKNKITDPQTGNPFVLDPSNRVHVKGNSTALNRTQLTELLKNKYQPGFIY
jgi:hypothetical protein